MAIIVPSLGLGTDFRHSNSFSFSYQVRDEYQKRPSYVLLSLALRCIFSSKYCSFFVSHLAGKASMPWPHLSNWPSPLVASQVIGARCQAPNAGCQVLLLVAKKSQVPVVTSGRKSTLNKSTPGSFGPKSGQSDCFAAFTGLCVTRFS